MRSIAYIQVLECGPEGNRATHQVPLGRFFGYALAQLPADEITRLRNDLTVRGTARLDGRHGRWHEYRMVSSAQAG